MIQQHDTTPDDDGTTFKYKSSNPQDQINGYKDFPLRTNSSLLNETSIVGLLNLYGCSYNRWIMPMQEINQFQRSEF